MRMYRSPSTLVIAFAALVSVTGACGGRGANSAHSKEPEPLEEWRTEDEWVLVSRDRCVTGPFTIEVPGREVEFGRRFVVEVFGDRGLPMDTQAAYPGGITRSGWGWSEEGLGEDLGDHAACRAKDEEVDVPATAAAGGRKPPSGSPDPGDGSGHRRRRGGDPKPEQPEPEAEPPTLDIHTGTLPGPRRHAGGNAWFPHGNPNYYAIDDILVHYTVESGHEPFQFKFWFHRPVDMDGVVIRIRDQLLVPRGPLGPYRAGFAARVAEVERRKRADRPAVASEESPRAAARGKVPPPPRNEVIPKAPGENVQWLPGYWKYHDQLEDFVWVEGTYVVRGPSEAAAELAAGADHDRGTPPESSAPTEDEESPEAIAIAQPLDARVPAKPAPRREEIPPPPAVAGAIWVPGYWTLQGTAWRWVAGRWHVRRKQGTRFRAPSVEVRGGIKVYLPGGWFRRR